MKGKVRFHLGNAEFTLDVDEGKNMETLHTLAVLGNPPRFCQECKNKENFRLDSNKDKESNIYINVVCTSCGAKAKLGQYKAGGYFWHKFEKYQGASVPTTDVNSDMKTDIEPF